MIGCLNGPQKINFYGFQIPRSVIPIVFLAINSVMIPNSDLLGHATGIVAAVILRFCGIYTIGLLPHKQWLQAFE